MSGWSLLLVALGLAMDAFAVSIASGIAIRRLHLRHAFLIATLFGVFQALMPVAGWGLGRLTRGVAAGFEPWAAAGLLALIGIKMITAAGVQDSDERPDPLNVWVLVGLAVATSVDAFAVGVSLSLLRTGLLVPVLVIGLVTFVMSFAGVYIGRFFGHLHEYGMEKAAGVVMLVIAGHLLIRHLLGG